MDAVAAIIAAAAAGRLDDVSSLLDSDPSLAMASTMTGAQPVHAAWFAGRHEVVKLLFERGVSLDGFLAADLGMLDRLETVEKLDANGFAALHRACYWGQVEAARLLLQRGSDPNAVTQDGFLQIRPLGCAVATADVPNPSDDEDVVVALVRLLLERGADVNGRRRDGLTALHSAAWRGHTKVIACLLEHGADPTLRGYDGMGAHAGQTARDVAIAQSQGAAAAML